MTDYGDVNPDGPNGFRGHDIYRRNRGQYYCSGGRPEAFTAMDKMTFVGADESKGDESFKISVGSLMQQEWDIQMKLYKSAVKCNVSDDINGEQILPPATEGFLTENNILCLGASMGSTSIISGIIGWDQNSLSKKFIPGEFWQPGGHSFRWSENYERYRCMYFGPVETIYHGKLEHHNHAGSECVAYPQHAYAGWVRLIYYNWWAHINGFWSDHDLLTRAQVPGINAEGMDIGGIH
jgi:hypothetical protein